MAWRVAKSLNVLLDEVNAVAPQRSKASDGTLGDPAHAARASRHNPNDVGVVCARDVTNDPANGMPVHALARAMTAPDRAFDPPEDLEYIISDRQVARRSTGWTWAAYTGENPHTKHAHFAVGRGPDSEPRPPYDGTAPWHVAALLAPPTPNPPVQEDTDMWIYFDEANQAGRCYLFSGGRMGRIPASRGQAYGAKGVPFDVLPTAELDDMVRNFPPGVNWRDETVGAKDRQLVADTLK